MIKKDIPLRHSPVATTGLSARPFGLPFSMETLEHTFPLPESEAHKLDDLVGQLPSQTRAYIQHHALMMVTLSGLAGCLIGFFWPRRKNVKQAKCWSSCC